jgi:uncharacterized protein YdaT
MPWTPKDSSRFTKRAKSPKRKRQWRDVANSMLERTGDEGSAIRAANGVVRKTQAKRRTKKRN